MKQSPSNLELVKEAESTKDVTRQQELAEHPSDIILNALSQNPHLDPKVAERVKDKLYFLTIATSTATKKTLDK